MKIIFFIFALILGLSSTMKAETFSPKELKQVSLQTVKADRVFLVDSRGDTLGYIEFDLAAGRATIVTYNCDGTNTTVSVTWSMKTE